MKKHLFFLASDKKYTLSMIASNGSTSEKKTQHIMMPWGITKLIIPLVVINFLFGCVNQPPPIPTVDPTQTTTVSPTATITTVPTKELSIGTTRKRDTDNMVMLYVPAGEFLMGSLESDPNALEDENPQHKLFLDSYWIDQTEVTNEMYSKCVFENACAQPMKLYSQTRENYYGNPEYSDYPVIFVTWENAKDYCQWAGVRLPSEAEWEKAARGEGGNIYPWGNEFDCHKGNFDDEVNFDSGVVSGGPACDGYEDTSPVGTFPSGVSLYRVFDMAGNVWEWVNSIYMTYPYTAGDGREDINAKENHVLRGGGFGSTEDRLRTAARYSFFFPTGYHIQFGLRCADSMNLP